MEIRKISDSDIDKYNSLAKECGVIFDSVEWLNCFNDVHICGIYDKNGVLIGGFSYRTRKIKCINFIFNLPYTPFVGLFYKNSSSNIVSKHTFDKNLISDIVEYFKKISIPNVSIAFYPKYIDMQPFIWNKYKVGLNYTYRLDLTKSIEDIFKGFSTDRRNEIKKAEKDGLVIKKIDDYTIVENLVSSTFSKKTKKLDNNIRRVLFEFANDKNSFAFAAFREGNPIAVSFCIYSSDIVYYLLSGYDVNNSHKGAGSLCVYNVIKHSKELGLKVFDFEGSMVIPVEKFLRGFGGNLTPYYTVNKALLPIELVLKFFKRETF